MFLQRVLVLILSWVAALTLLTGVDPTYSLAQAAQCGRIQPGSNLLLGDAIQRQIKP